MRALPLLLLLLPSWALAAPRIPIDRLLTWDGYLRTRGALLVNHDLDRGATPTTGEPIFPIPASGGQWVPTADFRARLDLGLHMEDVVAAHLRVDALDGLVLGSTPAGFPPDRVAPVPWAGNRQEPPSGGRNAFVDSIRLKHAWGEVMTPVGLLTFGRMPTPAWGLGLVSGPKEDVDDDFDDATDRIAWATSLGEHAFAFAFDWNAVGPTSASSRGSGFVSNQAIDVEPQDNLHTVTVTFARLHDEWALRRRKAAGRTTVSYGAFLAWRWQTADFPAYYIDGIASEDQDWGADEAVARRLQVLALDGWIRVVTPKVRIEAEGAWSHARVDDPSIDPGISLPTMTGDPWSVVAEVEVDAVPERLWPQLQLGIASGDPAPGLGVAPPPGQVSSQPGDLDGPQFDLTDDLRIDNFRVHPNFHVDRIFWRQVVGAVTDAVWLRPQLRFRPARTWTGDVAGTLSWAVTPSSTPTGQAFYGGEIGLHVQWHPVAGFVARGEADVFFPGGALGNREGGLTAQPAFSARLLLAVLFGAKQP